MALLELPEELLFHIAQFLPLADLLAIAETCSGLQTLVMRSMPFLGYSPHRASEVSAALSRTSLNLAPCASSSSSIDLSKSVGLLSIDTFDSGDARDAPPESPADGTVSPTDYLSLDYQRMRAAPRACLPVDLACHLGYWRSVRALIALWHGWTGAAIMSTCVHGAERLLADLLDADLVPVPRAAAIGACQRGQNRVLEVLHRRGHMPFTSSYMEAAACAGQLDTVCFLHERGVPVTRDSVVSAAYYGFKNVVAFFIKVAPGAVDSGAIEVAASAGRDGVIALLLEFDDNACKVSSVAVEQAAAHGHLSVLRTLLAHIERKEGRPAADVLPPSSFAVDEASANGHAAVVDFLLSQRMCASTRAMDEAAENGHFDIVQRLHAAGFAGTPSAVDYAARNGHLEVVRFLLEVGYKCTSLALDLAACYGHVCILRLLYECGYRCTPVALIYALNARHMPTVLFLQQEAGCTFIARHLFHAVHIGFLEGVRFLLDIGVRPGEGTVEHACTMGFLEIVKLLVDRYGQACSSDGMDYACARGHENIVRFLAARGVAPTQHALRGACRNGHLHIVQLLCERYAMHPAELDYQSALTAGHVHILAYLDARAGLLS